MVSKKTSTRQKVYKMKGCSKKTRKNYLGGNNKFGADLNLAYTGENIPSTPNPFLSYTAKGGSCSNTLTTSLGIPVNTNGFDKTIPNTGPPIGVPTVPVNQAGPQKGGNCGCGIPLMSGGKGKKSSKGRKGTLCTLGLMVGGKVHRMGCKCSSCRMKGGNPGIPYPNGLVGAAWKPSPEGWPGVNGVQGDRNYLAPNEYKTDVQTSIISTGAQPPFSIGGKGTRKRKQKGGTLSNFLGQDLINLGRQFQFGLGSAYNSLAGYQAPVNPMSWKGQLPNTPSVSTVKTSYL